MANIGQIIKSKTTERFTVIPNDVSQNKNLTFEEKGLLIFLLSMPSNWVLYKTQLHETTGERKSTVDRVWRLLVKKGYIVSVKVVENGKFAGWNHVVYDEPNISDNLISRDQGIPTSGFSEVGETPLYIKKENTIQSKKREQRKNIYAPLLEFLNHTLGKNYKTISEKTEKQINGRLKDGWTLDDIRAVIVNASKDDFHKSNNYKYLTLELITRVDKFERYAQNCQKKVNKFEI